MDQIRQSGYLPQGLGIYVRLYGVIQNKAVKSHAQKAQSDGLAFTGAHVVITAAGQNDQSGAGRGAEYAFAVAFDNTVLQVNSDLGIGIVDIQFRVVLG